MLFVPAAAFLRTKPRICRPMPSMWGGGRCLPFGWKFQSKTGITIRFGVRAPTLEPPSCPNDENDVDDQLALRKCLLLGKDRKHYRLQVLPRGQEGAISGALGGTILQ